MSRASSKPAPIIITVLPDEMLEAIFLHLSPQPLARVAEVCTRWQQVVQAPGFWTWVKLRVDRSNLASMVERLGGKRLHGVRRMYMKYGHFQSKELLEAVAKHPGLREVNTLASLVWNQRCWQEL